MCFDGLDLDCITPINESNIYTKCVICNCHKCKLNIEIQIKTTNVKEDISISIKHKCPLTPIEDECPSTPIEDECPLTPISDDISYENIDIVEEEQKKEEKKVVKKINIVYKKGPIYTKEERQELIRRFKNKKRDYNKRTLYKCRKTFADSRPRVGGRFVCLNKKKKKKL